MKRRNLFVVMIGMAALVIGGCGQTSTGSDPSTASVSETAESAAETAAETAVEEEEEIVASSSEAVEVISESLDADSGAAEGEETESESPEAAEGDADESEDTAASDLSYGPKSNVASTDVNAMDRNVLMTAYRFLRSMDSTVQRTVVDQAFAENLMGIPGELNRTDDNGDVYYRWSESSTVYLEMALREREEGPSTVANILLYNIDSSEYDSVEMFLYLEDYTYDKEIVIEENGVTFIAMVPEEWFYVESAFGQRIAWSYTEELADTSSNRINFAAADSMEELEKNLDSYEDLTEIEGVTISGNELSGRSYRYVGYDTIEYYGQIASGKYVSITFIKLPMLENSPQLIIRDNIVLS